MCSCISLLIRCFSSCSATALLRVASSRASIVMFTVSSGFELTASDITARRLHAAVARSEVKTGSVAKVVTSSLEAPCAARNLIVVDRLSSRPSTCGLQRMGRAKAASDEENDSLLARWVSRKSRSAPRAIIVWISTCPVRLSLQLLNDCRERQGGFLLRLVARPWPLLPGVRVKKKLKWVFL